jgi:hypothetical protein
LNREFRALAHRAGSSRSKTVFAHTRLLRVDLSDDIREYGEQHDDDHGNAEKPKNTGTKHVDLLDLYWRANTAWTGLVPPDRRTGGICWMTGQWRGLPGGRGGIRTHGTVTRPAVFKTAAFNHSATRPALRGPMPGIGAFD